MKQGILHKILSVILLVGWVLFAFFGGIEMLSEANDVANYLGTLFLSVLIVLTYIYFKPLIQKLKQ